jgi:hypothetical protein
VLGSEDDSTSLGHGHLLSVVSIGVINESITYLDTDQDVVKVDSLEEWPKLVIHLDDTLFKVNSSGHMGLDHNFILDLGSDLELVHVARSGSVVIEDSKDVDVVPVRVFGKFGNLSSAQLD